MGNSMTTPISLTTDGSSSRPNLGLPGANLGFLNLDLFGAERDHAGMKPWRKLKALIAYWPHRCKGAR